MILKTECLYIQENIDAVPFQVLLCSIVLITGKLVNDVWLTYRLHKLFVNTDV